MGHKSLTLEIEGMTCDGCAQTIRRYLQQDKGVAEVRINWKAGRGEIIFDAALTDEGKILKSRIFQSHYKAQTVEP